jgi:hypothetical protein
MNPFTLLSPGRWILYGLFALALVIGAYALVDHIGDVREAKVVARYDKAIEEEKERGRLKSIDLQGKANKLKKEKDDEIAAINTRHAAAIAGLRNRPERRADLPKVASSCSGVSGKELARGDAEFLIGYSADAQKLSSVLKQCERQYNDARQALEAK